MRPQDEQEGEGQEQNAEERNAAHANDNEVDNPEVLAYVANFDDSTSLSNEPVFTKVHKSTFSKKTEENDFERRNPAHVKSYLEDSPEDPASGANLHANTPLATHSEPLFSNGLKSISKKKEEEEHCEERNLTHAKSDLEDDRRFPYSGINFDAKTTLTTHNEPVHSNALNGISKKADKEHGERRNSAHAKCDVEDSLDDEGRNPAHAKSDHGDNLKILASGANIDLKSTESSQNENLSFLQLECDTSEITEKQHNIKND